MAQADTTTQNPTQTDAAPPPSDPNAVVNAALQYLIGQRQQNYAPPAPVDRSIVSLLGEAVGGGTTGLSPADRETAGRRALLNFGANLSAASDYSTMPHTFGSIFAQGVGGAQQSLGGSEAVAASRLAAQQAYEEKQQALQLEKIKTAIPLLQMQGRLQAASGLKTPFVPSTSIAAAGGDGTYEGSVGALEGSGKSATSTAAGFGQFTEPTWNSFVAANPDLFNGMTPEQVLAARDKPEIARQAVTWLAQQNAPALTNAGVTPSGPSLALAHNLGPTAAAAVMQAPENAPLVDVLTAAIGKDQAAAYVKANPQMANATAGSYRSKYASVPAPGFLAPATAPAPYKVASTGATAPAVSTSPPAPGSVAAPTTPLIPSGKGPLEVKSLEEYQREHPFQPTPEQVKTFSTELDPRSQADIAQQAAVAKNAADTALSQYKATGDPKYVTEYNTALDKFNTVVSANTTARQAQIDKGNTAYNTALQNWQKNLADSYNKAHELSQQQAGNLVAERQKDDMVSGRKVTDAMDTAATKANTMNSQLMQMYPLMDKLPQGITAAVLDAHPSWLGTLKAAHIVSPETADIVQMITGLTSYMATEMKPAGLGSMREYEFDAFRAALPNMLKSAEGQKAAMAFLLNMNDRIINESQWMRGHFQRPVADPSAPGGTRGAYNLAPDNITQMDKALGPILPHYAGDIGNTQALQDYRASQQPGRPYWDRGYVAGKDGKPLFDANGKMRTREYLRVAPVPGGD